MRRENNQQQNNDDHHLVQKTTQIDDIIQNNRHGRQQHQLIDNNEQQQHQDNGKLPQETDVDNASQQRKERKLGLTIAKNKSKSWIDAWSVKLLIIFITSALTVILVRYLQEDSIDVALPV